MSTQQQRHQDVTAFLDSYERICPDGVREDGWTPFARRLFLAVVAETGNATRACEYAGLSRTSAYALAARDPLFAAGWDAAAMLARRPLADRQHEQSMEGITETVTRSDGATVTRHRYDTRLSIAVLNRLDRRCDRAEERGDKHFALMRHWDEWLGHIGRGDDQAAQAIIDSAELCPNRQLPESGNPIAAGPPPGCDPFDNCWRAGSDDDFRPDRTADVAEGTWITTFPPPPGFDGYQNIEWDGDTWYERVCTPEEAALLDAHEATVEVAWRAELTAYAEAQRDDFFAKLRNDLAELDPALMNAAQETAAESLSRPSTYST